MRFRRERLPNGSPQIVVFAVSDHESDVRQLTQSLDLSAELRWLEQNRNEYAGLWVALSGEQILSSGRNGSAVYKSARDSGFEKPFVAYVEETDELPFAGW